jgi:hypothetical protein
MNNNPINDLNKRDDLAYCKFMPKYDVHRIDYSGVIDMDEGLARIENLEKYFNTNKITGKPLKVLMDARDYIKYSPETHDKLAKISRDLFYSKFDIILAVLNAEHRSIMSQKEGWFTNENDALNWLIER